MKKYLVPLLFAAALLVSCEKQQESKQLIPKGEAIEFAMSSPAVNTKTEYGDVSGTKQPINWINGDKFTVYCPEALVSDSDAEEVDYKVSTSGSSSSVSPDNPDVQLMWGGEGTHTFYAAYPAGTLDGNTLLCEIPYTQTLKGKDGVYAPMLPECGYMVAATTANKSNGAVTLTFKPIFTAIEFTVGPGPAKDVEVKGFRLESAKSTLAGSFSARINLDSAPTYADFISQAKSISVRFGDSSSVFIEKNKTISFTVIAVPQELNELTAYFSIKYKGDDQDTELSIPLKKDGEFITFKAGKKSRINAPGILGPETQETGFDTDIDEQDIEDYNVGQ